MNTTSDGTGELHVVVGAGQVGQKLARILLGKGKRVRMVRRSEGGRIDGVEWARGDVSDASFVEVAFEGASVVYNCANPARYSGWDAVLPALSTGIREGAARAKAKLVVLDNLYMYGRPAGGVMREDTPMEPCSKKGELRARLARELFEADARGDVRVACGRASDFFGAGTELASVFRSRLYKRLAAGRSAEVFGDPDLVHAYSYTPDVARGLAVLGEHDEAFGRVWHLPASHNGSTRELVEAFARALGQPARLSIVKRWMVSGLGLFSSEIGAVAEMLYQWEVPYGLDDSAFRKAFGVGATPVERAVRETLKAEGITGRSPTEGARALG